MAARKKSGGRAQREARDLAEAIPPVEVAVA